MQVTKIVEGGINLITGEQLETGIVVSNGQREVTVPVTRESMEKLAHLYADGVMGLKKSNGKPPPEGVVGYGANPGDVGLVGKGSAGGIAGGVIGVGFEDEVPDHGPLFVPAEPDDEEPGIPTPSFSDDEDYNRPPPSTDTEESGFEPGEEYDDSGTGVGSL
jgi:hypothetical protein